MNVHPAHEVSVVEASRLHGRAEVVVVDVRESTEHQLVQVEGCLLLPLSELPQKLDILPQDKPLLILCHHGGRSAMATVFLQKNGFDVKNIKGGIDAWSIVVDSSLVRY